MDPVTTETLQDHGPYRIDSGPTLVAVSDGTMFSRRLWVEDNDAPYKFRQPEPGERVKFLFSTDRDERASGEGIIVCVTYSNVGPADDISLPTCKVLWTKPPKFEIWDPQF